MTQARTIPGRLVRWVLLLALIVSATPASLQIALAAPASLPAAAPTNVFKLNVVSASAAGGHTIGELPRSSRRAQRPISFQAWT